MDPISATHARAAKTSVDPTQTLNMGPVVKTLVIQKSSAVTTAIQGVINQDALMKILIRRQQAIRSMKRRNLSPDRATKAATL